jgi:steroid 5-alpha reductase family enzyme
MWKTALLLILTLLFAPVLAYLMDEPPSPEQWKIIHLLSIICLSGVILCFAISTATNNYSQVDKLWSIMPVVYSWITAWQGGWDNRLILMSVLVTIWGLRLTYNFNRRGGYQWPLWKGEEDYRWAVLRQKKEFSSPVRWMAFNLFFISIYQMFLILLFTLPIVKSVDGMALNIWDWMLAIVFIILVGVETIADQQQWVFQRAKNLNPDKYKGFLDRGLWKYMRHPNYAAEQGIWIIFYCFSIVATGIWVNWSVMGVILLILLFKGSSDFSESISISKYSDYKAYQKSTPRFFPFTK